MLGLFAVRLHHLTEGADLPRDQHAARPHQGLAVPQGAEGARHRFYRFPARPGRSGGQAHAKVAATAPAAGPLKVPQNATNLRQAPHSTSQIGAWAGWLYPLFTRKNEG